MLICRLLNYLISSKRIIREQNCAIVIGQDEQDLKFLIYKRYMPANPIKILSKKQNTFSEINMLYYCVN